MQLRKWFLPKSKSLYGAVFLALLALSFWDAHRKLETQQASDYFQYWVTGFSLEKFQVVDIYTLSSRLVVAEKFNNLFSNGSPRLQSAARSRQGYNYQPNQTPFLYWFFNLISTGDYDLDYEIFFILSLTLLLTAFLVFSHLLNIPWFLALGAFFWCVHYFGPIASDFHYGNINAMQVGLLSIFVFLRSKTINVWRLGLSGGILAFLLFLKPNLVYVLALGMGTWWLISDWKTLAPTMAGFCLMSLVSFVVPMFLFKSVTCWARWMNNYESMAAMFDFRNLRSTFQLVPDWLSNQWIMGGLLVLIPLIIITGKVLEKGRYYVLSPESQKKLDILVIGLGGLIYILSGRLVHFHYFVLIIPMVAFLARFPKMEIRSLLGDIRPRHGLAIAALWLFKDDVAKSNYVVVLSLYFLGLLEFFTINGKPDFMISIRDLNFKRKID